MIWTNATCGWPCGKPGKVWEKRALTQPSEQCWFATERFSRPAGIGVQEANAIFLVEQQIECAVGRVLCGGESAVRVLGEQALELKLLRDVGRLRASVCVAKGFSAS